MLFDEPPRNLQEIPPRIHSPIPTMTHSPDPGIGFGDEMGPAPLAIERAQTNQYYDASYVLESGTALAAPRSPGETCCRL